MTWKPDVVLYHGNCDDGFGSAFAAWKRWGSEGIEYIPCSYGKEPPIDTVHGKNVLMVDFSFKRPEMNVLGNVVASTVVLDHHKTAQAELEPFTISACNGGPAPLAGQLADVPGMLRDMADLDRPPILAFFDMEKSGARMTWEFCHPGQNVPYMLRYIEDRDLWRFQMGHTKAFSAALRTYPQQFETWDKLSHVALTEEGKSILRGHEKNVKAFCENAYFETIGGHSVPVVNVPYHYASDCAHELINRFPDAPFAAAWFQGRDNIRLFSLCSEDSREDVSEIAKQFGGGGHRNAAGFQLSA